MLFRPLTILLLCVFSTLSYGEPIKAFNQNFARFVKTELNKQNIPGGAYAIVKGNKVVAIETFGHTDKSRAIKINKDTVFRLASVSKPFAATLTTMLANEQQLALSDPITKYVPNFVLAKPGSAEKIQIKHVLSHTSGLMPNAYDNLLHENWSMDKVISRFNKLNPICQPEKCYGYQNITYGLLAPAIEASQSKTYEQLLHERIFTPLDMKQATVGLSAFKQVKNSAKPHVLIQRINTKKRDQQGNKIYRYKWRKVPVTADYYKVPAAAGINASITDMAKWLNANLGYQPKTLPPALLTEMTTPRIRTKKDLRRKFWREHIQDAHYGYGWRVYQLAQHPIIYHSGWVSGFRADIGYAPDLDMGFAMLINAESNVINKISSRFWQQAHLHIDRTHPSSGQQATD